MTGQDQFNLGLRKTVFEIRDAINADRIAFREMLGVTPARYARIVLENAPIETAELLSLAQALDVDLDLILSGNLDIKTLAKRMRGNPSTLPERYADSSKWVARALGIQVILTHLKIYYGPEYTAEILRRLQLSADEFRDSSKFISPQIYFDLFNELKRKGMSSALIKSIGNMTLYVGQDSVGKVLAAKKSPKELYRHVQEQILPSNYDRLYEYKMMTLTDDGCSWAGGIREDAQDLFHTKVVGNQQTCQYRQGVLSSFLANIAPRFANISESECIYDGAQQCKYHLRWN